MTRRRTLGSEPRRDRYPERANQVLAILDNFASKDMPGRQRAMQDSIHEILAAVSHEPTAN